MSIVSQDKLVRSVGVLQALAERHGLSNLRRAGDGCVIADIASGRTYLDVARFELDAQSVLGGSVDVMLSGTEAAALADLGELATGQAA